MWIQEDMDARFESDIRNGFWQGEIDRTNTDTTLPYEQAGAYIYDEMRIDVRNCDVYIYICIYM